MLRHLVFPGDKKITLRPMSKKYFTYTVILKSDEDILLLLNRCETCTVDGLR